MSSLVWWLDDLVEIWRTRRLNSSFFGAASGGLGVASGGTRGGGRTRIRGCVSGSRVLSSAAAFVPMSVAFGAVTGRGALRTMTAPAVAADSTCLWMSVCS